VLKGYGPQAHEFLRQAIPVLVTRWGEDHPQVREARELLARAERSNR
jgi:hypothetical protein